MSLVKRGLEKGMKVVNEGELKRSLGTLYSDKIGASGPVQWRGYCSQIDFTTFKLSRQEVQGATQACLEQDISLLHVCPPESWKGGSSG